MLLSPNDPRRSLFLTVPALTGRKFLKKSTKNMSGFERVGKHGKKWRAWTTVDGKQKFLSDHAEPEDAAEELYDYENTGNSTLRSPSPGHRHNAKRAPPAYALHLSALSPYAHCALHHAVVAGMRMVSTSERKALTTTTDINKHTSSSSTDKSPEPWWDETFVGDRYLPLVYADELLVPLPGVPFLAYKHVE